MIQTTNIRRILDRIMRHPMMKDVPFEAAVEYAVDFIQLMGTPAIYDEKTAKITIEDYRGQLPCDFAEMIQVRGLNNDGTIPQSTFRYSADSFHMSDVKIPVPSFTYKIQGMCIFTSIENGLIEISYRAFATDEEGYPLLPDNVSFLRGLEAYIKLQWFTIKFDMGEINVSVFNNAKQEYCWAAGDAQSEFSRLDLDKAETLFNSFKTLLPRTNAHFKGFFDDGARENWHKH